ncbi:deoxyhypusine hydroxylase [Bacidia gigantensis]|uniref:deoxyhypusine hydroxylase n=1 Tax=Bacidia gigantensis TaxID=2732470 RepID=UPI001D048335|nr:deoxyhypusine hydroxylase [Bacidia gigantensis]KAG8527486.1 deoxyhypusine hydroxylase [Bacidia gigantensis]
MAPTAVSLPDIQINIPTKQFSVGQAAIHSTLQPCTQTSTRTSPIPPLRAALTSESTPLAIRFRALFSLKHHASLSPSDSTTIPAIEAIAAAFPSPSALLKHELAYCLGQSGNLAAVPYLEGVLKDKGQDDMCRHEAGEALGALGGSKSLPLLKEYASKKAGGESVPLVVKETCEIAIARIEWMMSKEREKERLRISDFASVDPAPPTPQDLQREGETGIEELKGQLMDTRSSLFERYRAMFALRDLASPPNLPTAVTAVNALAKGFEDKSALFRHEVAFVFGQLSHPASVPALEKVLGDLEEESMVRHEAAEALGSLGEEEGVEDFLKKHLNDKAEVVRDSVIVALDMAEYERSGQVEYAALPE